LWLVRRVIEAHDGSVEAHNRADGGAEIRLHLPA
jgi:signal transduction histidine kinase